MPTVLAIAAHPDDIEFVMAGTLMLLAERGWTVHYFNLADGSRGSLKLDPVTCAATRLAEARAAAERLPAVFHGPIFPDMEIAYTQPALRKVAAVVRQARASIVLTHSPIDYMLDHEIACQLAVSAAFCHGMPNFQTDPPVEPYFEPVTIYHAQPHGNSTPTGEPILPHFVVDIGEVISRKRELLALHASQLEWLDSSQGMSEFTATMLDASRTVARFAGRCEFAEGWRRRKHWGFCGPNDDPLRVALADRVLEVPSRLA
jgi:LmbE family N-acetylglucosaminyl deacetylase